MTEVFSDVLDEPLTWMAVLTAIFVLVITYFCFRTPEDDKEIPESQTKANSEKSTNANERENPAMESTLPSKEDVTDLLLDAQDVEMIKKVSSLDTSNPHEMKTYVKDVRSLRYKTSNLSEDEKQKEEETKRQQLAQIYALMAQEKEKFGDTSINDLQEQLGLYDQK